MKSYFAINHNPDAKDLKQLAQKTGLTKRVLQVTTAATHFRSDPAFPYSGEEKRQMATGMKEFLSSPVQISLLPSMKYMKRNFPERGCFMLLLFFIPVKFLENFEEAANKLNKKKEIDFLAVFSVLLLFLISL